MEFCLARVNRRGAAGILLHFSRIDAQTERFSGLRFSFFDDYVFWRCLPISNKELQINEEIRDKEVRVIDSDGSQLGIMPVHQALEMAYARNLDLVKIAPQAKPPVCKIIDYGKFRFEQAKREKEARKNQRVVEIKEIRLSLNIDTHDFNTKLGHAKRFLEDGNKVKVSIRFRGREMGHPEHGYDTMSGLLRLAPSLPTLKSPRSLREETC